jgi:hypothetical protein
VSLLPEDLLMPDDFSVKWEYCLVDNRYDSDSGLPPAASWGSLSSLLSSTSC